MLIERYHSLKYVMTYNDIEIRECLRPCHWSIKSCRNQSIETKIKTEEWGH